MDTAQTKVVTAGVLFVLILLSGLWTGSSGRPPSTLTLTIHKLIGLGALVFFVVTLHQMNITTGLSAAEWAGVVVTVLLFVGTIILGGVLSLDRPVSMLVLNLHRILPILIVLSTVATLYFVITPRA